MYNRKNLVNFCSKFKNSNSFIIAFFIVFCAYTSFNLILSATLFFTRYPESYTWTELFINYEGGFIRRGLIGEILYLSSYCCDTRIAMAILFIPTYIIFIIYSIKLFKRGLDFCSFLIIIISPGLVFFFTQDRAMFGRKDIFFEAGFVLQFYILSLKNIGFLRSFFYIIFIYVLCLLVHESTIFYSVLPFSILLEKAHSEKKFVPCCICLSIIFFCSIYYIFAFSGNTTQKDLIIASWSNRFSIDNQLALQYLGKTLSFQINQVKNYFSLKTISYYILAFILTFFPVIYINKTNKIINLINNFFNFPFYKICLSCGLLLPWTISFLAIDYGRHIHTATLNIIAFLASISILSEEKQKNYCLSLLRKKYFYVFMFIFAFSWKLWHFAINGNIVTLSFPFRIILLGWTESLSV